MRQREGISSVTRRGVAKKVVKSHHAEFHNMPTHSQDKCHVQARAGKRQKCADNTVAIAALDEKLQSPSGRNWRLSCSRCHYGRLAQAGVNRTCKFLARCSVVAIFQCNW